MTFLCLAPALPAAAQDPNDGWISETELEEQRRARSPFAGSRLGVELSEPVGTSRVQIVSRGTFSDGASVFSSQAAWTAEGRFHLSLVEELGITGVLPMGVVAPGVGETRVFIGNVGLGVAGGGSIDLVDPVSSDTPIRLRLGGGIDAYFPSAPTGNDTTVAAESLVAALRAYEPQLYVPGLLAFRARGQASFSFGNLTTQVEVNLVPGALVKDRGDAVFLVGAALRAAYEATPTLEPFLEMGATTQVAGAGQIRPPFMITPGVRLHLSPYFSPAFFMSVNFVAAEALMFGIDLAAAMPNRSVQEKRIQADDPEDFLGGGI